MDPITSPSLHFGDGVARSPLTRRRNDKRMANAGRMDDINIWKKTKPSIDGFIRVCYSSKG